MIHVCMMPGRQNVFERPVTQQYRVPRRCEYEEEHEARYDLLSFEVAFVSKMLHIRREKEKMMPATFTVTVRIISGQGGACALSSGIGRCVSSLCHTVMLTRGVSSQT